MKDTAAKAGITPPNPLDTPSAMTATDHTPAGGTKAPGLKGLMDLHRKGTDLRKVVS
jgi:hypothetical protein